MTKTEKAVKALSKEPIAEICSALSALTPEEISEVAISENRAIRSIFVSVLLHHSKAASPGTALAFGWNYPFFEMICKLKDSSSGIICEGAAKALAQFLREKPDRYAEIEALAKWRLGNDPKTIFEKEVEVYGKIIRHRPASKTAAENTGGQYRLFGIQSLSLIPVMPELEQPSLTVPDGNQSLGTYTGGNERFGGR